MKFAVVGAGFSGAIIARKLVEAGYDVKVYDSRQHVAGNCHTERDVDTGIMLHKYGPHIFHTDNQRVWDFINTYSEFKPFTNRVKAKVNGSVYSLPINLHTINQFFDKDLSPNEAKNYIQEKSDKSINEPKDFEEQALSMIGRELYEAFFKGYTIKQWGMSPKELPASILKRLPVRFNYDDNYFAHKYQGMPKEGYTDIVEKILSHEKIEVFLGQKFVRSQKDEFDHVFYTGPIDVWFNSQFGKLPYRTLDFEESRHSGDFQGNAVINYCDENVPFTRISEHLHFSPWEKSKNGQTIIFKEFSRQATDDDIPYYPVRLAEGNELLEKYVDLAKLESNVTFCGRLGTYRYLDMDVTILEALELMDAVVAAIESESKVPVFSKDPLEH